MLFTGQFEHSIDAKQRLAVPAEIRNRWDATRDGAAWYAVPWLSDAGGVIRLYTENEFHRRSAIGDATLLPDEDEARIQQTLFGLARRIEPDSAGRVRLPEDLLQFVSIRTDVTLVGAGDRLEIHDREAWNASLRDRLQELPELMKRLSAKRNGGGGA